jgi:predicted phosphodiesterase
VDRDGDGTLERGPGEPLRDRGGAGDPGGVLVTFGQITDAHLRDEESPARAPFLDRYGSPFESTFRPHEALTPHLLAAAVRALNRETPDAVMVTGDLIDNAQQNELDQATAILDGGRVNPDSGAPGYRGVQEEADPDPLYYRPDLDAPRHPGLLDEAQKPFRSPGLRAPWHLIPGNHDTQVAGEADWTAELEQIATGDTLTASLDPAFRPTEADRTTPLNAIRNATTRQIHVPRDDARRPATLPTAKQVTINGVRFSTDPADDPHILLTHAPPKTLKPGPNLRAVIAGHTHRNRITRRPGYWLIETASLVDFPQQVRMVRIRERAIETWLVDHDGKGLAGTARELAFLDAQGGRPQNFRGGRRDRNVRLSG